MKGIWNYIRKLMRYTPYSYPVGYGNLLGGAAPVRMFVPFVINPNDITSDKTAVLTLQDQSVEFRMNEIREAFYPDMILQKEEAYETVQQLAAFKWRMDKMISIAGDSFITKYNPGETFAGEGQAIINLFDPNYGASIHGGLTDGFDRDHLFSGITSDLPHFTLMFF